MFHCLAAMHSKPIASGMTLQGAGVVSCNDLLNLGARRAGYWSS